MSPLPPPAEPAPIEPPIHDVEGEELAPIIPKLDALAAELGCRVVEERISGGALGYYEIDTRRIAIDERLSANSKVKTRCHEYADVRVMPMSRSGCLADRADRRVDVGITPAVLAIVVLLVLAEGGGRWPGRRAG